ncbi:hypothetical protein LSCM4_07643 [Leishmania orientalis]|uniref:Uncharacterized protein n=1 Tax=Leishmania orientalis TaxID=2249476 RepID=A0A836HV82_9TRYP|nr:hypothetical protein LSCM4_07643 [Leishmania orientalis]
MEAPSSRSLASSAAATDITNASESFGAPAASSMTCSTASNDVAPTCLGAAGGAAPSSISAFTKAFPLSGDSTLCVGSSAMKTATGMLNVTSFDSSGTTSAGEVPSLYSEHAATVAPPFFAARASCIGTPETVANPPHPSALPHPLEATTMVDSRVETQRAGETGVAVEAQPTEPLSSPLPIGGCFGESSSRSSGAQQSRTLRSSTSEPLSLTQTTRHVSPHDSALSGVEQGSGEKGSARWAGEVESLPAAVAARPTVGNSCLAGQGVAGRMAVVTQCASTDSCAAACTAPASSISSADASAATDAATPLSPELEVLATAPALLVGRVPVRIHWCCATHWRAVQRTERGAQWAVDGAHADVYCVPAHLHGKRERRSLSNSGVETKSESERHGRAVLRTGENTRRLSEAAGEAKQQHFEARALPASMAVPDSTLCAASRDAAEREKDGLLRTRSVLPQANCRTCAEIPTCEFCGREVETYDCDESDDKATEASTSTTEAGRVCCTLPQWSPGRRGSAPAKASAQSSSQLVEIRSNRASISTPQILSSSSDSEATTVSSEMVDVAPSTDTMPMSNSAREEALMAAVALLQ